MSNLRVFLPGLVRIVPVKLFSMCLTTVVFFLLVPFTVHALGVYAYGIWVVAQTVTAYLAMSECGFGSAIEREMSISLGKKQTVRYRQVFWEGARIFLYISVGIFLLTIISGLIFFMQQQYTLAWVLWFSGAALVVTMLFEPVFAAMRARLFFMSSQVFLIVLVSALSLVQYIVLKAGGNVVDLAAAHFIVGLAMRLFLLAIIISPLALGRPQKKKHKQINRTLIQYSFKTFFVRIAELFQQKNDTVIAVGVGGVQKLAPYSLVSDVNARMYGIIVFLIALLNPLYARVVHNKERQVKIFLFSWKIAIVVSGIIWAVTFLLGRSFIILWLGPNFESSIIILAVLSCTFFLQKAQSPAENVLYVHQYQHFYAGLLLGEVGISMLSIFVLYFCFHLEMLSIAYGLLAGTILIRCTLLPIFVCRLLEKKIYWYLRFFIVNCCFLLSCLGVVYMLLEGFPSDTIQSFLIHTFCYIGVSGVALLLMFSKDERCSFFEALRSSWLLMK